MTPTTVFTLLFTILVQERTCEAGKAFGGMGAPGGFGPFGGAGFGNIALINQERRKLILAQRIAIITIDSTNTTVQNNIAAAQTAIDQEVLAARNEAQTTQNKQCADQYNAALKQVNSESVKTCDQADQLADCQNDVTILSGLHSQLGMAYGSSAWGSPQLTSDLLAGISKQVDDLQAGILEKTAKIENDAEKCIQGVTAGAHAAVTTAASELDNCDVAPSV